MLKLGLPALGCQACIFALSVFLVPFSKHAHSGSATLPDDIIKVSHGNYVRYGKHGPIEGQHLGTLANNGFIVGNNAVAVIDPGGDRKSAQSLRNAIENYTDKPISVVILTHLHPDHMLGSSVFDDVSTVIVHERYAAALPSQGRFYIDSFGESTDIATLLEPTLTVAENTAITVDLGNRPITVTAHSTAHSQHDISILDNRSKTLWTGDLVFDTRTPALDGSLLGWLQVFSELATWDVQTTVPGHGRAGSWTEISAAQQKYLEQLLVDTRNHIRAGRGLSGLLAEAEQATSTHWQQFTLHHPINVSKAFTELEWE